uniref:Ig-like domain-containing protein n=1 Tax=Sinocyclocheilus grahami TaxID=75366 RepID=A0A672KU18_SINGR
MHSAYCCSHSAYNVSFDTSIIRSRVNRFQIKPVFSIFFLGIKCQSMESTESTVQKKPGETLTLSCRGSGFSFGCCSMHWIRQQAGKPLVWMGRVNSDSSGYDYSESFKSRTEITRDNSKSMVYLKLSGLTADDSAVYYCAKQAQVNTVITTSSSSLKHLE